MIRSHLINTHMSRYRPLGSSARRHTGHSSKDYRGCVPTQQSDQRDLTLRADYDFPPGRHNRSWKYMAYVGVAPVPPVHKIISGVTHGY